MKMPELTPDNYEIISYKFHFTWILILFILLIVLKYFVGPWLYKSAETIGDKVITKFFSKIQKQLEEFKVELRELTTRDKKELKDE